MRLAFPILALLLASCGGDPFEAATETADAQAAHADTTANEGKGGDAAGEAIAIGARAPGAGADDAEAGGSPVDAIADARPEGSAAQGEAGAPDASDRDAGDAGASPECTPLSSLSAPCYDGPFCAAGSFCATWPKSGGGICVTLPAACACAETLSCECLRAHAAAACEPTGSFAACALDGSAIVIGSTRIAGTTGAPLVVCTPDGGLL